MKETVTVRAIFAGIIENDPPQLVFTKLLSRPGGKEMIHTQMVSVLDPSLLAHLRTEVAPEDEIEIILETDWSAESIPTELKGFSRMKECCVSDLRPVIKAHAATSEKVAGHV